MSEVFLFMIWAIVYSVCAGVYLAVGFLVSFKKNNEDKTGFQLRNITLFWPWFVLVDLALFAVKHIKIEVVKWKD